VTEQLLPSWRPGATRDAVVAFLDTAEPEPVTEVGARLGWTVISMARDWATIFA